MARSLVIQREEQATTSGLFNFFLALALLWMGLGFVSMANSEAAAEATATPHVAAIQP